MRTVELLESAGRIRQGEGSLPPVDGHDPPDPPERDGHADGQRDGPVEPVEVERENEDPEHDTAL